MSLAIPPSHISVFSSCPCLPGLLLLRAHAGSERPGLCMSPGFHCSLICVWEDFCLE